jgi:hypothetical protein
MSHVFNPDTYVGKRVLVMLHSGHATEIRQKRLQRGLASGNGNDPHEGSVYPGVIVADFFQPVTPEGAERLEWTEEKRAEHNADARKKAPVNIQVLLDGTDSYWLLSTSMFDPELHVSMIAPEKDSTGKELQHAGQRINVYVHGQQPISYWEEAGYTDPEPDARGHWILMPE